MDFSDGFGISFWVGVSRLGELEQAFIPKRIPHRIGITPILSKLREFRFQHRFTLTNKQHIISLKVYLGKELE